MLLSERLNSAKDEVDSLKQKLNCEYTEKLNQMEMTSRILKEEIKKKNNEIKELTNETL